MHDFVLVCLVLFSSLNFTDFREKVDPVRNISWYWGSILKSIKDLALVSGWINDIVCIFVNMQIVRNLIAKSKMCKNQYFGNVFYSKKTDGKKYHSI